MNILMTGATGFLGFPLLNKLVVNGHKVTIITRETSDLTRIIQLSAPINVITLSGESVNNELEFKLCEAGKFDLIIHAATDYNRVDTLYSPGFINAMLPIYLLNFAIKYKVEKFINFDTFFNNDKISYDYLGFYIITKKYFCDYAGLLCQKSRGVTFLNLKIFHMYGPGDRADKFIPFIFSKCQLGEKLDLTSGIQKRDFIYIDDVISATQIVVNRFFSPGFYNFDVGTGISTSIRELVVLVNALCGNKSILDFGALSDRSNEIMDSRANTFALNQFGWQPAVRLEVGLKNIIQNYILK